VLTIDYGKVEAKVSFVGKGLERMRWCEVSRRKRTEAELVDM
jgi:hypothetical protein